MSTRNSVKAAAGPSVKPAGARVVSALRIVCIRYRGARIEHHFMPDGVVRRFVVLERRSLRELLDKPRRTEIPPCFDTEDEEMLNRTSRAALKEMMQLVKERKSQGRPPSPTRSNTMRSRRIAARRTQENGVAVGVLVFAGVRSGQQYCVDVLDDDGQLRRIEGIDLARALQQSGARIGERVRVEPGGTREVVIEERSSGGEGSRKRTQRATRNLFVIMREKDSLNETQADPVDDYGEKGLPVAYQEN